MSTSVVGAPRARRSRRPSFSDAVAEHEASVDRHRRELAAAQLAEQARLDAETVFLVNYRNTRSGARIFRNSRAGGGMDGYITEDGSFMILRQDAETVIARWRLAGEMLEEVRTLSGAEYRALSERKAAA